MIPPATLSVFSFFKPGCFLPWSHRSHFKYLKEASFCHHPWAVISMIQETLQSWNQSKLELFFFLRMLSAVLQPGPGLKLMSQLFGEKENTLSKMQQIAWRAASLKPVVSNKNVCFKHILATVASSMLGAS